MSYQTKNYTKPGGNETHIGGKLVIDSGGTVEFGEGSTMTGLPAATTDNTGGVKQAAAQADSTASTIAETVTNLNTLLANLRAAGILAAE